MILCLNTAQPEAQLYLYDGSTRLYDYSWQAHRTLAATLLAKIEEFLQSHQVMWDDIDGLVVYQGPGSFTGLRIGCTVANTVAYARDIPVVGVPGEEWLEHGLHRLMASENDTTVMPFYGAEPRITTPKK